MKARVESVFNCEMEQVIKYVKRSDTLDFIASPILKFIPVDPERYPVQWENGKYQVRMKLFSFIPFGKQYIQIEKVKENDPTEYIIRDNGSGDIISKWDHWIYITPKNHTKQTKYVDEIEIKAGVLTLIVWCFANIFYRWRQYRWKILIANDFRQLENKI